MSIESRNPAPKIHQWTIYFCRWGFGWVDKAQCFRSAWRFGAVGSSPDFSRVFSWHLASRHLKLIQTKKPCDGVERRRGFRLCFCRVPNPPPKYTGETAHAVTFFFLSGSQPPPTNVRQAVSSQTTPVFFKEPVCAAKIPLAAEVWLARKRSLEREDVLRKTLYQGCVATWEKSELRNELLRNSHWSGAEDETIFLLDEGTHGS